MVKFLFFTKIFYTTLLNFFYRFHTTVGMSIVVKVNDLSVIDHYLGPRQDTDPKYFSFVSAKYGDTEEIFYDC